MSEKDQSLKQNHSFSRLIVFFFLGFLVFSTAYTAQKMNKPLKIADSNQNKPTIYLTPTPASEDLAEIPMSTTSAVLGLTTDGKCLVSVFDKKYNITDLLSNQDNREFFECGSNMSTKYESKYGNDIKVVFEYEIDDEGNFINKK